MYLNINEEFISINGEGINSGKLMYFVRLEGCNLECLYCDTEHARNGLGYQIYVDDLIKNIENSGINNVLITGGEPLIQSEVNNLIDKLITKGYEVDIETNGSVDLGGLNQKATVIMDYKLPSSNMQGEMEHKNLRLLDEKDGIKFVIGSLEDIELAKDIIDKYGLNYITNIYFTPIFKEIDLEDIVEKMKEDKIDYAYFQLQIHKFIWHPDKKGV